MNAVKTKAAEVPPRAKVVRIPEPTANLKAERIQLAAPDAQTRLKAERIQEAVKALPGWAASGDGRTLDRLREFPDGGCAAAYAGFVLHIAAQAGQPVGLELAGRQVAITLRQRARAAGVSEAVIEFARALA